MPAGEEINMLGLRDSQAGRGSERRRGYTRQMFTPDELQLQFRRSCSPRRSGNVLPKCTGGSKAHAGD